MRVLCPKERREAGRVVLGDGGAHAGACRESGPPCTDVWRRGEDAGVDDGLEHVEVTEDRAERSIDEGEGLAREIRASGRVAAEPPALQPCELGSEVGAFVLERRFV